MTPNIRLKALKLLAKPRTALQLARALRVPALQAYRTIHGLYQEGLIEECGALRAGRAGPKSRQFRAR